ncbi:hypothetical protein HO133_000142 [Letharia lupina]|uniref:Uncharacterized protein n=1 Tax=Letharia lupina TaxID=560253 RepID=A0A8H6CH70_9LECA|nr:uncharacterized protein HO133_000142 [Letharia lupina]KAF6223300.1 hypothetical protein HO133_000142 [Letharia lupina]
MRLGTAAAAASLNLLPAPSTLNASHNHPHEYQCTSLPSWTGGRPGSPTYKIDDCDRAIRAFEQDVARNPGRAQWLSLGFPHTVPGYDVGDVPSKPDISGGGTMGVIATWRAVSEYVRLLSEACQVRRSELGWTAYDDSALGIFLWATDSAINQRVPYPDQGAS